jgi:anaerobic selenocysteine-containing dehydrogenase
VTVEDSMSCVHASEGRNTPASPHLLSEPAIVAGIAAATFPDDHRVDWAGAAGDYSRIRDMIEDTIPIFAGYNRRIEEPGGFVLPHPASQRRWTTASGSAEFVVVPTPDLHLPADQLRLFTIRSHDQFNTTIYGKDDRYRGISGDRHVVFMHPDDLADRGLRDGQAVVIRAEVADGRERIAAGFRARAYDVPRGCAAAYFPEANVLVPIGRTAKGSNTPAFKLVPVTVTAEAAATAGAQRQQQDAGAVAV